MWRKCKNRQRIAGEGVLGGADENWVENSSCWNNYQILTRFPVVQLASLGFFHLMNIIISSGSIYKKYSLIKSNQRKVHFNLIIHCWVKGGKIFF